MSIGWVIPTVFGINGDPEIIIHKGFVEYGVDATPATFKDIADLMIAAKQKVRYYHKLEQIQRINQQFA